MSMALATKSSVTSNATATATADAKCSGPKSAEEPVCPPFSEHLRRLCGHCLRVAAAVLVCYSFAVTAWRVRRQPQDLAFVAGSASLLAALFACLRRAERLAPDSPAGERRQVQATVWALSTALSCGFAYRVAAVMPPLLAVLVWSMTALVALVGLYLLVLCRDQQYHALPGDDAAGDRKASAKMSPTDDLESWSWSTTFTMPIVNTQRRRSSSQTPSAIAEAMAVDPPSHQEGSEQQEKGEIQSDATRILDSHPNGQQPNYSLKQCGTRGIPHPQQPHLQTHSCT